jgi:hypothetical protein
MKRALILGLGALLVTAAVASAQGRPAAPPTTGQGTGQAVGANFVDANGDGICDNFQAGRRGAGQGQGMGYGRGKGNGTHVGPQDGTGFGKAAGAGTGTGICDGTGPKGKGRGPRK